jgi:hypothetical protein
MTPVWIAIIVIAVLASWIIVFALRQVSGKYDEQECEDYLRAREE